MEHMGLISLSEAADRLGCSYETMRRWANKGALETAVRLGITQRIRVDESEIEQLARTIPRQPTHISGK